MKRILVAGIGNIFLGDDGFGVEVARALRFQRFPPNVRVVDFGIRSYDLAFALSDGYDAVILVDAAPHGRAPGTVSLIQPEPAAASAQPIIDGHTLTPAAVLQLAARNGDTPAELYLVACEPH